MIPLTPIVWFNLLQLKSVHEQLAAALSRSKPKSKKANKKEMKQRRKELERNVNITKLKPKPVKSKPKKPQAKYVAISPIKVFIGYYLQDNSPASIDQEKTY